MTRIDSKTKELFKDPLKRRAWVIYQLSLKGQSLASLARRHGQSRQAPGAALSEPYPAWEKRIAHEIGIEVHILFPERYDTHGKPNRIRGRRPTVLSSKENNTTKSGCNRQNREAA